MIGHDDAHRDYARYLSDRAFARALAAYEAREPEEPELCAYCDGTGEDPDDAPIEGDAEDTRPARRCTHCEGSGYESAWACEDRLERDEREWEGR